MKQSGPGNGAASPPGEIEALQHRIAEQAETIRHLWQRLDAESAERRQLSERIHGLLAQISEQLKTGAELVKAAKGLGR